MPTKQNTLDMRGLTIECANVVTGYDTHVDNVGIASGGAPVSGSGATVTLTAAQSGSKIMFDRAAGIVFTLPAPQVGLSYEFYTPVTVTSNAYKVITNTGTVLLIGGYSSIDTDSSEADLYMRGNGTDHVSVSMNGSTTGGLIGTALTFTCVSSLLWLVEGKVHCSGNPASAFATS